MSSRWVEFFLLFFPIPFSSVTDLEINGNCGQSQTPLEDNFEEHFWRIFLVPHQQAIRGWKVPIAAKMKVIYRSHCRRWLILITLSHREILEKTRCSAGHFFCHHEMENMWCIHDNIRYLVLLHWGKSKFRLTIFAITIVKAMCRVNNYRVIGRYPISLCKRHINNCSHPTLSANQ